MRFYFPDSQDQIDPNFDFEVEQHPPHHVRQRDDLYAHEALHEPASTGVLVSMGVQRYTMSQRHRFIRLGVREFFRLDKVAGKRIETLGDCGAFSYVGEEMPPYTVDEVLSFYEDCRFDAGVSIDHVITGFQGGHDQAFPEFDAVPVEWTRRKELSIELAANFLREHKARQARHEPIGAAQGWSPASYADSVEQLQKIGYKRIALGGLVALKTKEILSVLEAVDEVRHSDTEFHLFGVTRTEEVLTFQRYGVTSIDSTSPFRQAFKDDKDNYHTAAGNYVAIRIPQVDGNPKLRREIRSGKVDLTKAQKLERACLDGVRAYSRREAEIDSILDSLYHYGELYGAKRDHTPAYHRTLSDRPWESCPCAICREVGVEVILFRGSERNKRRGFHNLWVFNQRLQAGLSDVDSPQAKAAKRPKAKRKTSKPNSESSATTPR